MVEIRSFRSVFHLERRIYRVDRLRLNPAGVPVRGVVYFLALACGCELAARLPLLGRLLVLAPWYLYELALPGALAALFCLIAIEGRQFHLAAFALLRFSLAARELSALQPRRDSDRWLLPRELLVLVDGSEPDLRKLRYAGPGAVRVHRDSRRRGRVVELTRGGRFEVAGRR